MKNVLLLYCLLLLSIGSFSQNYGLKFDGQSEYLTAASNTNYDIGDGFTIEAWLLAEEWADLQWQGSIVTNDAQGPDRGFAFRCGDNGILSFVMAADNTWEEAFSAQVMNANQWHHVAAVVDNGTISLYVDGQQVAGHAFSGTPSSASDMPLNIGNSAGFSGRNFNGVLDEIRIWSDARTEAELNDFMTEELTGNEDDLVAYFPFNEGAGTLAGDVSGTSNDAQLIDMDDSNWVSGYTLPDFDVSVQRVFGADVVNVKTRPVKLKATVQNTGLMEISDIELSIYVNDEFAFSENLESSISAGEVIDYEFQSPIDLTSYNDPVIQVIASHPDDENALNNSAETKLIIAAGGFVVVSNNEQHNFGGAGQLNTKTITFPGDMHRYEQILMRISLNCPSTGCDPWDQYGNIMVATQSGTYELARFITPYGIACGNWIVDITDFKSILKGQVEFQNFIQVWGQSGWLLDAQIELIDNNSSDIYSIVSPLWETSYWVYGDPGIEDDLDELSVSIDNNTENSHLRMTITGHGQGNTSNAAEFFEVNHTLNVNGSAFENHHLWKSDCADNVCDNQNGTWLFSRAGWCPGQEVTPYVFNTSSVTDAGNTVAFDYVLQDYTNLLNTGYNNSGHTEPHYKIYSYLVETSTNPYEEYKNLVADNVDGVLSGDNFESATISFTNNGFSSIEQFTINIFNNNELVASEEFTETVGVGNSVEKEISVNQTINTSIGNIVFAEVVSAEDDNPGDNIVKSDLISSLGEKLRSEYAFEFYPNPTSDGNIFMEFDEYWVGSQVKIYSSDGKLIDTILANENNQTVSLQGSGLYWYVVSNNDGENLSGKISFLR